MTNSPTVISCEHAIEKLTQASELASLTYHFLLGVKLELVRLEQCAVIELGDIVDV